MSQTASPQLPCELLFIFGSSIASSLIDSGTIKMDQHERIHSWHCYFSYKELYSLKHNNNHF